jgi:threonine/homoserine/homoserine lactone efflux protein
VISFSGAAYLVFLSLELIAFKGIDVPSENMRPHSLTRGMIANFLNPAPYMFWFTVGAPLVVKASVSGPVYVIFFIGSFYVLLVGSKMIVSMVAEKSRHFLHSKHYVYTMKFLGILLLIFSAVFIRNGLKYFHLL